MLRARTPPDRRSPGIAGILPARSMVILRRIAGFHPALPGSGAAFGSGAGLKTMHERVTAWTALEREVDAWRSAGREVTLWWRDDDTVEPSPALSRLLGLRPGCPLGLAVIPAAAGATLAGELTEAVDVLVHGFAHANHAASGDRKSEYPAGRVAPAEMREGRERLEALFGERVLPVFVPPWNRMGEDAAVALPAAGYRVLSGYRGRPRVRCPASTPTSTSSTGGVGGGSRASQPCSAHSPGRSPRGAARRTRARPASSPTTWRTTPRRGNSSTRSSRGARTRPECAGSAPATQSRVGGSTRESMQRRRALEGS